MEDAEILDLYFARDEQAVKETNQKYGRYCGTIAQRILNDSFETEECVNDTWIQTWNSIPPQRPSVFKAFLAKITRNLAFNRWNAAHAEKRGKGETAVVLDELAECIPSSSSTEAEVNMHVLSAAINDYLYTLPVKQRDIFVRRVFFNEDFKTIARRFLMREGNVRTTLARVRSGLKTYLEDGGWI